MLSEREKEVLALAGLSNKEIARLLHITKGTVQRCFSDMLAKYKVKNRTMLLLKAIEAGELHRIDMGFWDDNGEYIPDIQIVNLRKE